MTELEWRTIPGWHRYEASSDGRIRNKATQRELKRYKSRKTSRHWTVWATNDECGYGKPVFVHLLVLVAYHGPKPEGKIGLHGEKGTFDNSVNNVYWGTYEENNGQDRVRDGTDLRGEAHPQRKLDEDAVRHIRRARKNNTESVINLARKYNVSETVIRNVVNYVTWKHVSEEVMPSDDQSSRK